MEPHRHLHGDHGRDRRRPLLAALVLTAGFLVVQLATAVVSDSLALLSDAGHMATDVAALGITLAAITAAARARPVPHRTFGLYRLEILAALVNAAVLLGVAGWVLVEAIDRLGDAPQVPAAPVVAVGITGMAVNAVAFRLLRHGADNDLALRGAALEVAADLAGSAAVVVAATVWWATGWTWIDPVAGAAIAVFVVPRAWRLGAEALRVLVQAAPATLDVGAVRASLAGIDGVVDVHDLHVWTLTSQMEVASAHVMVRRGVDPHTVLDTAREVLAERHGLVHATLQIEPDDHAGCDRVSW